MSQPGDSPPGDAASSAAPSQASRDAESAGADHIGRHVVAGERATPSVNDERSVQARLHHALGVGLVLIVTLGFIAWYYGSHFLELQRQSEAERRAREARAAGELKPPRLFRPEPVAQVRSATPPVRPEVLPVVAPPPPVPAPPTPVPPPGPRVKSPAELERERLLNAGVMLVRNPMDASAARGAVVDASSSVVSATASVAGSPLQVAGSSSSALANALRPTTTPSVRAQLLPDRRFLLPKGAFIDCTLETALDSTLAGLATCITAVDIFSADGTVVLIERGTRFVGETRADVRPGQARIAVLWNEARTPEGVSVALASPGTDELGRAGIPGEVDRHFWERFGAAILVSFVDGAIQAAVANQRQGTTVPIYSPNTSRDVLTEVLRNTINIPPTIVKNHGERIQIIVARDVDFRPVYTLQSNEPRR